MTTFDEATKQKAKSILHKLREEIAARSSDDPVKQTQLAAYWTSRDGLFRQLACRIIQVQDQAGTNARPTTEDEALREFAKDVLQKAKTDTQLAEFTNWLNGRHKFLSAISGRLWHFAGELEPARPVPHSFKFEVLAHGGWSSNAQRYETEDQARSAGESLRMRWMAVEDYRVVPVDEPPNQPSPAVAPPAQPTEETEPRQPTIIHVRDKKPVTPQLPPPLPMSAYVRPAVQELFDYQLYYKGVFGRNRTEKTGSAVLFKHIPRTTPKSLSDLMPRIRETLADPGVSTKPGVDLVLVVKELPIELDRGFEKFLIGSGQELYRGMKSVLLKTEIG